MTQRELKKVIALHLLSFNEWIDIHPELKGKREDCYECDGSGGSVCEACDHSIPCDDCNGRGYHELDRIEYEEQKRKDIRNILAHPEIKQLIS